MAASAVSREGNIGATTWYSRPLMQYVEQMLGLMSLLMSSTMLDRVLCMSWALVLFRSSALIICTLYV